MYVSNKSITIEGKKKRGTLNDYRFKKSLQDRQ